MAGYSQSLYIYREQDIGKTELLDKAAAGVQLSIREPLQLSVGTTALSVDALSASAPNSLPTPTTAGARWPQCSFLSRR